LYFAASDLPISVARGRSHPDRRCERDRRKRRRRQARQSLKVRARRPLILRRRHVSRGGAAAGDLGEPRAWDMVRRAKAPIRGGLVSTALTSGKGQRARSHSDRPAGRFATRASPDERARQDQAHCRARSSRRASRSAAGPRLNVGQNGLAQALVLGRRRVNGIVLTKLDCMRGWRRESQFAHD